MKILLSIIGAALWLLGVFLLIETAEPQDFGASASSDPTHIVQPSPIYTSRRALAPSFYDLNLVAIPGFRAVSDAQVLEIYEKASYYFRQLKIGFRIKRINLEENPCLFYHNYVVSLQELECLKQHATDSGYRRKKMLTYYMLPPWVIVDKPVDEGGVQTTLIGGFAESICGQVAFGHAVETNQNGEDRLPHSATILAHELSHLLCATHQDHQLNLMHSNANAFTTQYQGKLPVLRITKRQVRRAWSKQRKQN